VERVIGSTRASTGVSIAERARDYLARREDTRRSLIGKESQLSIGSRTEILLRQAPEAPVAAAPVAGAHEQSAPVILTLVDMAADDWQVVDAAAALAGARRATIVLLHVARPLPWRRRAWAAMLAIEAAAQRAMRRLAGRWLPRSHLIQTSVRFGDPVQQAAKATMIVGATVVVAASRPARWLWWRNRDRRLCRYIGVPVVLVPGRGAEPDLHRGLTRPAPSSARGTRAAA
jgi:nucleotide-binding universal stress UspA family protein